MSRLSPLFVCDIQFCSDAWLLVDGIEFRTTLTQTARPCHYRWVERFISRTFRSRDLRWMQHAFGCSLSWVLLVIAANIGPWGRNMYWFLFWVFASGLETPMSTSSIPLFLANSCRCCVYIDQYLFCARLSQSVRVTYASIDVWGFYILRCIVS